MRGLKVLHSQLRMQLELSVQGAYAAHRPNAALVQYWPGGQSASVAQSASLQRPALQTKPLPPQVTSVTHRRTQALSRQAYNPSATRGSSWGAHSIAVVQTGKHKPCVTSQRPPCPRQSASAVQGLRVVQVPLVHCWFEPHDASEMH